MTQSPTSAQAVTLLLLSHPPILPSSADWGSFAAAGCGFSVALPASPLQQRHQHSLSPPVDPYFQNQTNGNLNISEGGKGRYPSESGSAQHSTVIAASETARVCQISLLSPTVSFLLLILLLFRGRRKNQRHLLSQLSLVLLALSLLIPHGQALPWVEVHKNSVKLRAQFCQPVPEEHLRSMLGKAFDPDRMSNDDPLATGKRSNPEFDSESDQSAFDTFYTDDPTTAGGLVDEDIVEIITDSREEEALFQEEVMEKESVQMVGKKSVVEEDVFYRKEDFSDKSSPSSHWPGSRGKSLRPESDQSYLYMKRRRRAAIRQNRNGPDSTIADYTTKNKKSRDSVLPLRLLLGGRNRKLRRKLKKAFRKKARKLGQKPPPWTCQMKTVWGRLKEGYFPRYLKDGRCLTKKCFYRLYNCVAQKYVIKILKRDPDYCNPLPTFGVNSTYEQKWEVVRYKATVGCNCGTGDSSQNSSSEHYENVG